MELFVSLLTLLGVAFNSGSSSAGSISLSKDDANNIVDVKVTAKGNWGMHLDGIARVQLPK